MNYKIGQKVWHISKGRWATVESEAFKGFDGWGYYISHSGWLWSVPAEGIASHSRIKVKNALPNSVISLEQGARELARADLNTEEQGNG